MHKYILYKTIIALLLCSNYLVAQKIHRTPKHYRGRKRTLGNNFNSFYGEGFKSYYQGSLKSDNISTIKSYDLRDKKLIGPIRNQLNCGPVGLLLLPLPLNQVLLLKIKNLLISPNKISSIAHH